MIFTLEDYSNENMIRPLQWNRGNIVRMLIFIVMIYVCIISSISIFLYCDQNDELISEYQDRLARISTEMKYIQRQHDYLLMEIQKKMGVDVMHAMTDPSLEYEITRRRIYENTQELWYFINEQFQKVMITEHKTELAETNIDMKIQILKDIADIKRSLLSDQEELVALDGFANWRREESEAVSGLIQRRLDYIQNPKNCSLNKKVVCSLDKECGYGCQIHQIVFCMIYAYATERTLLLDPSKPKRIKMWQNVLMPLSRCSLSQDTFMEMLDQKKVSMNLKSKHVDTIYLTNMDDLRNIPKFLITAIPEDLVNRIIRFNGDPYSWWVGQFVKFILKPTKYFHKNIQSKLAELDFKNPIVGIHIRGLEKMKSKTMNDTINYYMYHVEDYYDQLAMTTNIGKRRVFVATDDLKVYKIIVNRYLNYTFISNIAKHTEKQTISSVISFVTDVSMLALCNYVVGSFNSNLGRLAYEMMQSSRDAAKSFQSLDDVYFLKKQDAYMREAIYRHTAQNGDEFDFEEKDHIGVVELALGKYAIGVHDKTRKSGAFPLYKTSKILETYPFPKYKKVPLYKETRLSINSL